MAEVEIVILPDGSAEVGVACVKGASCKDLTREIEKALGTVTSDKHTREMYEREGANVKVNR